MPPQGRGWARKARGISLQPSPFVTPLSPYGFSPTGLGLSPSLLLQRKAQKRERKGIDDKRGERERATVS